MSHQKPGAGGVIWVSGVGRCDDWASVEKQHAPSASETRLKQLIEALGAELSRRTDRDELERLLREVAGEYRFRQGLDGHTSPLRGLAKSIKRVLVKRHGERSHML